MDKGSFITSQVSQKHLELKRLENISIALVTGSKSHETSRGYINMEHKASRNNALPVPELG